MKPKHIMIALIILLTPFALAAQNDRKLVDQTEDGQVLVIGSFVSQVTLVGRAGMDDLTFFRLNQPIKPFPMVLQFGKPSIFFVQGLKVGDKITIGELVWTRIFLTQETTYFASPMFQYSQKFNFKVAKPGINYYGSFIKDENLSENQGFVPDPKSDELSTLKEASGLLKNFPKWKNLVDQRIKELSK